MPQMDAVETVRTNHVLPCIRGRLLDLGCGYNNLVSKYGAGVGVDVYPWPGIDVLIGDAARLPFPDRSFDTVTIVAALNHIPNREVALDEVNRVLADEGQVVLTMISSWVGMLAHILFRQDEYVRGKLKEGETKGMSKRNVRKLLIGAGFQIKAELSFELTLNRVYVATKHNRG